MKKRLAIIAACAAFVGLSGCAAVQAGAKFVQDNPALVIGTVVGGVAGNALGVAGSKVGHALATGAGAVAGGAVGKEIDKKK